MRACDNDHFGNSVSLVIDGDYGGHAFSGFDMQVWKEVVEMKIRNKINCVLEIKNLNNVRELMNEGLFCFTKKYFASDVQCPCKDPHCIYKNGTFQFLMNKD